jgi:hypothetical protein
VSVGIENVSFETYFTYAPVSQRGFPMRLMGFTIGAILCGLAAFGIADLLTRAGVDGYQAYFGLVIGGPILALLGGCAGAVIGKIIDRQLPPP